MSYLKQFLKVQVNIIYERLHRYVFDYCYQSDNDAWGKYTPYKKANRNNPYRRFNGLIEFIYSSLCSLFRGWRMSLRINFPNDKKYKRYEPKNINLFKCEFNKLSIDLRTKYLFIKSKELKLKN
jgi:hypothetical protein